MINSRYGSPFTSYRLFLGTSHYSSPGGWGSEEFRAGESHWFSLGSEVGVSHLKQSLKREMAKFASSCYCIGRKGTQLVVDKQNGS